MADDVAVIDYPCIYCGLPLPSYDDWHEPEQCINALRDNLVAMTAERDALRAQIRPQPGECGFHCEACSRLEERTTRAEADAERYRELVSALKALPKSAVDAIRRVPATNEFVGLADAAIAHEGEK